MNEITQQVGRKKLPDDRRKGHMVRVRVTEQERVAWESAAEMSGVGVSEWLRSLASAELEQLAVRMLRKDGR